MFTVFDGGVIHDFIGVIIGGLNVSGIVIIIRCFWSLAY